MVSDCVELKWLASVLHFPNSVRISKLTLVISLGLWGSLALAGPHGGEGQDMGGNPAAQLANEGGTAGGESTDGGGGASAPTPLSAPQTIANSTVRSVPDRPGTHPNPVALLHKALVTPRSPSSMKIYEGAYNADSELVNQWLRSLAR